MISHQDIGNSRLYGGMSVHCGWVMWGDSLTDGLYAAVNTTNVRLPFKNCGIGGELSSDILSRASGVTLTYPINQTVNSGYVTGRANLYEFSREFNNNYTVQQSAYRTRVAWPQYITWTLNNATSVRTRATLQMTTGSFDASANTFNSSHLNLRINDRVWLSGSLVAPGNLSLYSQYFIKNTGVNSCQLASSSTGSAIDITSAGTGPHYLIGPFTGLMPHTGGNAMVTIGTETYLDNLSSIIWAGANDGSNFAPTSGRIKAMTDRLKTSKYLVCGIVNNAQYSATGDNNNYVSVLNINKWMSGFYGTKSLDVRQILYDQYQPGTDSAAEHTAGVIPARLRADDIHLTNPAYTIVTNAITAKIRSLGWDF